MYKYSVLSKRNLRHDRRAWCGWSPEPHEGFWIVPHSPQQREFCTEGLLGQHALGMLGRTLKYLLGGCHGNMICYSILYTCARLKGFPLSFLFPPIPPSLPPSLPPFSVPPRIKTGWSTVALHQNLKNLGLSRLEITKIEKVLERAEAVERVNQLRIG